MISDSTTLFVISVRYFVFLFSAVDYDLYCGRPGLWPEAP